MSYPKRRPHTNTNAVITIPCNMYISKLMLPKKTSARWLNNFVIMPLLLLDMANQYINKLNGSQNNGAKRIHEGNKQYGIYVNAETDTTIIISSIDNFVADCRSIHCLKCMEMARYTDDKLLFLLQINNTQRWKCKHEVVYCRVVAT